MSEKSLFLFEVDGTGYAIAAKHILQIVRAPRSWAVPGLPADRIGVVLFRGEILPVVSVSSKAMLHQEHPRVALIIGNQQPKLLLIVDHPHGLYTPDEESSLEGPGHSESLRDRETVVVSNRVYTVLSFDTLLGLLHSGSGNTGLPAEQHTAGRGCNR